MCLSPVSVQLSSALRGGRHIGLRVVLPWLFCCRVALPVVNQHKPRKPRYLRSRLMLVAEET
jgi:hypothetical protein